jgi:hypothetical protein
MILNKKATLNKVELEELNPLEMMKYKTRTMLNEILDSKDVKRITKSPWEAMNKNACVNSNLKLVEKEENVESDS